MKKLLLTALIATSLISSAFAGPVKKVNYFIRTAFESAYPSAKEVEWKVTEEYSKASFTSETGKTEVFYDLTGNFIGKSVSIDPSKLPTNVKRSLARKFANYMINEAIQFEGADETAYFISARNEKESVLLKAVNGDVSIYKASGK